MATIQTLLVTRSPLYTEGVLRILEHERTIRVAPSSDFVLPLPPAGPASRRWVVLCDVGSSRLSFDNYAAELDHRQLQPRLVLFGDDCSEELLLYYLSRRAHGWVHSSQLKQLLAVAIKHVADGGIWMPHQVVARFVEKTVTQVKYVSRLFQVHPLLSQREQEVWDLVSQGAANKEVAARLRISERTVKFHVGHLLAKLEVTNRRELMICYVHSNQGGPARTANQMAAPVKDSARRPPQPPAQ